MEIKWDDFFESNKDFYQNLILEFSKFLSNLDLSDIEKFYGSSGESYNYIPSILMNGGFGPSDKEGNLYYIRRFQYNEKEKRFEQDIPYLVECLFHEFSHPFVNLLVNLLVDKYFHLFSNIDDLFLEAKQFDLPLCYCNQKTLLYEYFVRANAFILKLHYYPNAQISTYMKNHGFIYLDEIVSHTLEHKKDYDSYEAFFEESLIPFINQMPLRDSKNL